MEEVLAEKKEEKPVSLALTLTLSAIAFLIVFLTYVGKDFGYANIGYIFRSPAVLQDYIARSFGGSLAPPAIHVAIASIFKSKRNNSTRRRIFIGWSIVIICVQLLTIVTTYQSLKMK
jgi:hypothetical protein